jgi:uncharacterized circularly permuted ATP-grasp superfamily protein
MLVGRPTAAEREAFRARILAQPDKYIAQPTLSLSTCPTFTERAWRRDTSTCALCFVEKTVNLVPGG